MSYQSKQRFAWLAGAGTIGAIIACYGTLALISAFAVLGISLNIDGKLWAAAIATFAVLAFFGLLFGYRQHRNLGPLVLGAAGVLTVIFVMFVSYDRTTEILAFAGLVVAAFWDWRERRSKPIRDVAEPGTS